MLALAVFLLFVGGTGPSVAAEARAVTVGVDARAAGMRVSEHLFGNNLKAWGGAGELLRDAGRAELNAEAVERLKGLGATVLRFPGGSHAEQYRWREAAPPATRWSSTPTAGSIPSRWEMASSGWSHFAALSHPRADLWLLRPTWHVLSLYSRHCRGSLLPVVVDAPAYDHTGYSIVRARKETPAVDAVAVRRADGLTVALINRDPEAALAVVVAVAGAEGMKEVRRHTFAGAGPFSGEFGVRSETLPARLPLSLELPPCSVSVVVLDAAR